MSPRSRRLLAPLVVGALTLGATAYVGLVDPNEPGHYPLCPTKALTGLDCPACGGLRATHALVHGDLLGALDHNAFVVLVLMPLAVIAWSAWVVRAWRGPSDPVRAPDPLTSEYAGTRRSAGASGTPGPEGPAATDPLATAYAGGHLSAGIAAPDGPEAREAPDAPTAAAVPRAVSTSGWSSPRLMWGLLALALVFTVVRNIDAVPALQWLGSESGRL